MDYKEKVIALLNSQELSKEQKEKLENIFPELKESEDERIRKELIDYHRSMAAQADDYVHEAWIAWLEKQGTPAKLSEEEQNRFAKGVLTRCALSFIDYLDAHKYEGKMCVSNGECEDIENAFHNAMWDRLYRYYCKYIEKQGEQKPTDKVEPKFKVGDWICNDMCIIHITSIENGMYYFDEGDGLPVVFIDKHYHLWTIQDAMDGDVLVDEDNNIGLYKNEKDDSYWESYIYLGCDNCLRGFRIGGYHVRKNTNPATKEQHDLLFQKMREAGYQWNAEKKKLKKIEPFDEYEGLTDFERTVADICIGWIGKEPGWKQYIKDNADILLKIAVKKFNSVQDVPFEQKSAWSEKDEQHIDSLLKRLDGLCRNEFERTRFAISEDRDWLESLKQRIGG